MASLSRTKTTTTTSGCSTFPFNNTSTKEALSFWEKSPYYATDAALLRQQQQQQQQQEHSSFGSSVFFWARPTVPELSQFDNYHHGGVWLFHNALVSGEDTTIWNCHALFTPTSCGVSSTTTKPRFTTWWTDESSKTKVIRIDGPAVLLYQYWSYWYYHATIEALPRIASLLDYLRSNPTVPILAEEQFLVNRQETWNRLLNLTNPWITYHSKQKQKQRVYYYHVEYLWVPMGSHCGHVDPVAAAMLSQQFRTVLSSSSSSSNTNILVPTEEEPPPPALIALLPPEPSNVKTCKQSNKVFHGMQKSTLISWL